MNEDIIVLTDSTNKILTAAVKKKRVKIKENIYDVPLNKM